jgi:hypothetical protein
VDQNGTASRDKMRVRREKLRAPGFAAEARRQSALVARSRGEAEDQAFVDAISAWRCG